jgi:hypothetical protein
MNYGRNFEFRASPHRNQRAGRYYLDDTPRPIGAPVVVPSGATADFMGRLPLELATGATDKPVNGLGGILVYEHAPVAFAGSDPAITTASDIDLAPAGKSCQLVSGDDVKVAFKNTAEGDFFIRADYPKARVMVDDVAGLAPGDFLTPGAGTDSGGYWEVTTEAAEAWLIVLTVNDSTGEVEAQVNF